MYVDDFGSAACPQTKLIIINWREAARTCGELTPAIERDKGIVSTVVQSITGSDGQIVHDLSGVNASKGFDAMMRLLARRQPISFSDCECIVAVNVSKYPNDTDAMVAAFRQITRLTPKPEYPDQVPTASACGFLQAMINRFQK